MPIETNTAVDWALTQTYYNPWIESDLPITKDDPEQLVNKVREYFNDNSIDYNTFSFTDLEIFI